VSKSHINWPKGKINITAKTQLSWDRLCYREACFWNIYFHALTSSQLWTCWNLMHMVLALSVGGGGVAWIGWVAGTLLIWFGWSILGFFGMSSVRLVWLFYDAIQVLTLCALKRDLIRRLGMFILGGGLRKPSCCFNFLSKNLTVGTDNNYQEP
jgi:hypothetical protein